MRLLRSASPFRSASSIEGNPLKLSKPIIRGVENVMVPKIVLRLGEAHEPSARQHSTFDNRALNILDSLNISYRARSGQGSVEVPYLKNSRASQ